MPTFRIRSTSSKVSLPFEKTCLSHHVVFLAVPSGTEVEHKSQWLGAIVSDRQDQGEWEENEEPEEPHCTQISILAFASFPRALCALLREIMDSCRSYLEANKCSKTEE